MFSMFSKPYPRQYLLLRDYLAAVERWRQNPYLLECPVCREVMSGPTPTGIRHGDGTWSAWDEYHCRPCDQYYEKRRW